MPEDLKYFFSLFSLEIFLEALFIISRLVGRNVFVLRDLVVVRLIAKGLLTKMTANDIHAVVILSSK